MIRVVMFDLGSTLEQNQELLPMAAESVAAVARFEAQDERPIEFCLVSNFHLADRFELGQVGELFADYLEILEKLGLRDLFEPVERRVTLSAHANALKPDRKVFELALERLGVAAKLEECMFITENASHIAAAKALGMECLRFGADGADSFENWGEGIIRIALKIDPTNAKNIAAAVSIAGEARGFTDIGAATVNAGVFSAAAKALLELDDHSLGKLEGVNVQVPAQVELDLRRPDPRVEVHMQADARDEATAFVRSLEAHGKLGGGPSLLGQPTHEIQIDKVGRRVLKRTGYD